MEPRERIESITLQGLRVERVWRSADRVVSMAFSRDARLLVVSRTNGVITVRLADGAVEATPLVQLVGLVVGPDVFLGSTATESLLFRASGEVLARRERVHVARFLGDGSLVVVRQPRPDAAFVVERWSADDARVGGEPLTLRTGSSAGQRLVDGEMVGEKERVAHPERVLDLDPDGTHILSVLLHAGGEYERAGRQRVDVTGARFEWDLGTRQARRLNAVAANAARYIGPRAVLARFWGEQPEVARWDLAADRIVWNVAAENVGEVFEATADGRLALTWRHESLVVWGLHDGSRAGMATLGANGPSRRRRWTCCAIAPDGSRIAAWSSDGDLALLGPA